MKLTRLQSVDQVFEKRPGHACVVRYGGIGDCIVASSVFPGLKAQGYRLTVNCSENGLKLLRYNPHVDEILFQPRDFVPNDALPAYWDRLSQTFDKFVNLSGSVEGALLAHPNYDSYFWPWERRHREMNVNYLERTHEIAGVAHDFDARFYASPGEKNWAKKERKKHRKVIMLSLSGSSVHKAYPYWDEVVGPLLRETEATIYTVGDLICQVLEVGWEKEPRIKCRSGRWGIRKTLAFAEVCDVVVGTETGVMNAVGLCEVPKVLLLSHSSIENLSKHWKNTVSIQPFEAPCYPCHRFHQTSQFCARDPKGGRGARCAHSIRPEEVLRPVLEALR